jgi:Transcriptional regulators
MTVKELAKIAGVSPSAISIVINNKKGVSDKTRAHILNILKEHNYSINKKKDNTKNLCFLKYKKHGMLVEQNEGFIAAILDAVEAECCSKGYSLSIVVSDNNFSETIRNIDYDAYDGIILLSTELEEQQYNCLNDIKKPYVVVDNILRDYPCNSVAINNQEIVQSAISHLAGLNHKSIGYFHSSVNIANFTERMQAFVQYSAKMGLDFKQEYQFDLPPTLVGAYNTMKKYLKSQPVLPSSAFADNDTIAIGAIKALLECGYRVPQDISIIGFDDIHFSAISSPPLTTMRIQKALIGTLAVRQVCDLIDFYPYTDVKIQVGGELVKRSSTTYYTKK